MTRYGSRRRILAPLHFWCHATAARYLSGALRPFTRVASDARSHGARCKCGRAQGGKQCPRSYQQTVYAGRWRSVGKAQTRTEPVAPLLRMVIADHVLHFNSSCSGRYATDLIGGSAQ
jgi:hypothetical protein